MRKLKPDPVPRELLEQLVDAASWAPSGSNAQAYSWVIVTDRRVLKELKPLWAKFVRALEGSPDADFRPTGPCSRGDSRQPARSVTCEHGAA